MDFPTKYTKDNTDIISVSGSPTLQEYEYSLDKEGRKQLVKKDSVINVYERIQADRDSCDINKLMERFALGDSEALDVKKGFYADVREMPKDYREVFERGLEAEQYFDSLPVELKEMFDNSHTVFFTEFGSKEFDSKVERYNDKFINHQFEDDSIVKTDSEVNYNE